jgi:hypothetical protein
MESWSLVKHLVCLSLAYYSIRQREENREGEREREGDGVGDLKVERDTDRK